MDLFQIILFVIVTVYVASMIFLLGFGLMNSLKYWAQYMQDKTGQSGGNLFDFPNAKYGWYFKNYVDAFTSFSVEYTTKSGGRKDALLLDMFWNSIVYSGCMAFFCIATEIMMAYCISKFDFKGKNVLYSISVIVMLIPIVGSLASEVQFANFFGFRDNLIGVCIMRCKFPGLYFLVFYAAFKGVPWTYAEAAQLDGAGHFRIFIQIMLPMIGSTLMAVFILLFIANWNEYYTQMIFLPNMPTLSYGLYMVNGSVKNGMNPPIQLASSFISCLPIIVLFVACNKQIMGNVAIGGIKG